MQTAALLALPTRPAAATPESRALLLAAGGPETRDALRDALSRVTRWEWLIEQSMSEGTQPVFTRRVLDAGEDLVPPEHARTLRGLASTMEIRLRYMERRLGQVLQLLSRAGIPVMLLKGSALAHTTYGSFGERPMSDLDLLVGAEHALPAQALLLGAGWNTRFPEEAGWIYGGMQHLPPLTDARLPAMRVHLELHTHILPPDANPFGLGADELWSAALPAAGRPAGTFVPSPLHRLLHACLHFAWCHMLEKAAWRTFQDVAAICRGAVDWDELVRAARQVRGASCCYWTLRLAREHSGARVPDRVLDALRPDASPLLVNHVARHLVHEVTGTDRACPSAWLRRRMWEVAIRPDASGHGRARPWDVSDRPWRLRGEVSPDEPVTGYLRPALSPTAWARYLLRTLPA